MDFNASIHPEGFEAKADPGRKFVWIDVKFGAGKAGIFMTPELCDQLDAATEAARRLLAEGGAS